MSYKVLDGLFGVCIGDALGVPVEFYPRERLKKQPVTDMIGHGTHNQPPGTWSDDASLTLCLAESLCEGFDLQNIGNKFCKWLFESYWCPHGKVYDVGHTTREAIFALKKGVNPIEAGGRGEYSNGNGSLMRILPMAHFLHKSQESLDLVHQVSSLTHAHARSKMACTIYIIVAMELIDGKDPLQAYAQIGAKIPAKYEQEHAYKRELKKFSRILEGNIAELSEEKISSSTYVVHSLEAALWWLLNSNSYQEATLKAVNLGKDTDTIGAITGGLAGIYYGWENIPSHWVEQLARKDDIIALAQKLEDSLAQKNKTT